MGGGCVACANASTLGFSAALGDCACFSGTTGSLALVETAATATAAGFKACVPCPNRTLVFAAAVGYRAADLGRCQACADPHASMTAQGTCACDAGYLAAGDPAYAPDHGVTCVLQAAAAPVLTAYPAAAAAIVSYNALQLSAGGPATSTSRTSKTFARTFLAAAAGCVAAQSDQPCDACQSLANLCVLQLYSPAATACALYSALAAVRAGGLHQFVGWPSQTSSLPFLFYGAGGASGALSATPLGRTMSFDAKVDVGTSDELWFVLAKYALNGTLVGVEVRGVGVEFVVGCCEGPRRC